VHLTGSLESALKLIATAWESLWSTNDRCREQRRVAEPLLQLREKTNTMGVAEALAERLRASRSAQAEEFAAIMAHTTTSTTQQQTPQQTAYFLKK